MAEIRLFQASQSQVWNLPSSSNLAGLDVAWTPSVEVFQRGDELVVRAELPGLDKNDVDVEVSDDVVTIRGERKQEHEEEREGFIAASASTAASIASSRCPKALLPTAQKRVSRTACSRSPSTFRPRRCGAAENWRSAKASPINSRIKSRKGRRKARRLNPTRPSHQPSQQGQQAQASGSQR
jgi:hypothetical protein